jgi:PAS domain S-box-containing protein
MSGVTRLKSSPSEDDRYRLLVDAITDYAIYMLDPQGHVTSWNAGARRFKGYEAGEIIGRHFSQFYTPEDQASGLPATALRTATEQGRFEREGWRVRKDGSQFWAHVIIDPIWSPSGELMGFAKITRDLTERKLAEETLRSSQEQFRLLVQGVTDYAIYMLDPQGQVSSWNAGAQRIKGYAPEEIVGRHFSRFYTPEDVVAGAPAAALACAEREGRFEKEGWRVRKDGSRFWAHVVIDPIRGDDGQVIGFAKITRDITERRETQRALDETREALLQSQKLDAIGQLTGGVAHDFNNLLMAVMGSLELLRKHLPATPKAHALLDNALLGAQRGATLTQRMLAFARKQELALGPVDVAALVNGMSGLLERSLGPTVQVATQFQPDMPLAFTDGPQLESALLNLAVNARDAMPNGGRITISGAAATDAPPGLAAGAYVCLTVADTGEGMDEETLGRAAEPFYTTKGIGKGTGLGLSMVHGLAEQSGGRLRIESRPGQGTRVELWLPVAQAARTPATVFAGPAAPEGETRPLSVLAVDDDALVLMNTAAMLEDLGHQCVAVGSAVAALAALDDQRFDVVVTDFAMPHMSGLELATKIAARWPATPVVLASGYAELPPSADSDIPRLAKPYGQADLAAILRRVAAAPERATS